MCKEPKFYVCKHCGNFVGMIHASGVQMICCGDPMTEVVPNTTDAAQEKHVPVIAVDGNKVTIDIGSVPHPMTPEHHIAWVYLETEQGGQRKCLAVDGAPHMEFALTPGDKAVAAYAYCNLHGLWKASL
ncbi:desulfoferrodoxin [Acetobacterium fimetarium]|uniref:Desulfoferrodoxin n=1 Tax=Acetobacterium fimetarium TaxID=52691 RepID=A0ABR6WUB9_9FIRM|nr:desulfoferrodoxin family protein [Acetobacterium fimetarium]MBC3804098.1 desulfoferrodoxin [Acetobacterium fimetarium]